MEGLKKGDPVQFLFITPGFAHQNSGIIENIQNGSVVVSFNKSTFESNKTKYVTVPLKHIRPDSKKFINQVIPLLPLNSTVLVRKKNFVGDIVDYHFDGKCTVRVDEVWSATTNVLPTSTTTTKKIAQKKWWRPKNATVLDASVLENFLLKDLRRLHVEYLQNPKTYKENYMTALKNIPLLKYNKNKIFSLTETEFKNADEKKYDGWFAFTFKTGLYFNCNMLREINFKTLDMSDHIDFKTWPEKDMVVFTSNPEDKNRVLAMTNPGLDNFLVFIKSQGIAKRFDDMSEQEIWESCEDFADIVRGYFEPSFTSQMVDTFKIKFILF